MGRRVGTAAGLACLWLCLQSDIYFPLTFAPELAHAQDFTPAALLHGLFVLLALIGSAAALWSRARLERLLADRPRAVACAVGLVGLAGALALYTADADDAGGRGLVLAGAGCALFGLWLAAAVLLWTCGLVRSYGDDGPRPLVTGFALSLAVLALAGLLDAPMDAFLLPCPALTGFLLVCAAPVPGTPGGAGAAAAPVPRDADRHGRDLGIATMRELPADLAAPTVCLAVCAAVCVRLMSGAPTASHAYSNLLTALFGACVLTVALLAGWRAKSDREAEVARFSALAVMLVLGLVLCVLLEERQFPLSPRRFIVAVEHCLEVYLLAVVVRNAWQKRLAALPCACAFLALGILLPRFAANDLAHLLTQGTPLQGASNALVAIVCAFVVFGITVWSMTAFMRGAGRQAGVSAPTGTEAVDEATREMCARMGRTCGLSQREVEVAALLCAGLSQKTIAESMTVAESTVKTHVKHLYAKLDVHNRQELAAVAEGYRPAAPRK